MGSRLHRGRRDLTLSQWLSRINDDIDIGFVTMPTCERRRLGTRNRTPCRWPCVRVPPIVGGGRAVGSREIAGSSWRNPPKHQVLYHLNDEKSLQLTGFPKQSSATQTANTTSQAWASVGTGRSTGNGPGPSLMTLRNSLVKNLCSLMIRNSCCCSIDQSAILWPWGFEHPEGHL